jgi:hypothetical protein
MYARYGLGPGVRDIVPLSIVLQELAENQMVNSDASVLLRGNTEDGEAHEKENVELHCTRCSRLLRKEVS